ncbi:MAG: hypothetical protein J6S78_04590 [Lachnospiraceae bacterium]|nr:hypothetical protein [Lachnospiraceae bacterium]
MKVDARKRVIGSIRIAVETVKIFNYHRNFRKSQEKPKKESEIFAVVLIRKKDFHRNFRKAAQKREKTSKKQDKASKKQGKKASN